MTKALITGGAGFTGSHLAERLLQRGWTVEVLDDLSTGSLKNVAHLKTHADFGAGGAQTHAGLTHLNLRGVWQTGHAEVQRRG
jgi:nucleoside-diphosphate-sugar epimerase